MCNCNLGNWHKECENIVNKQIGVEYWASYQYHLMWSYFDRSDVALKNIADFFKKSSLEERDHAHKFMEYQNLRGGEVKLDGVLEGSLDYINKDPKKTASNVIESFKKALEMEQIVYKNLLGLHRVGDRCGDPQFTDFLEGEYLEEQVSAINEITKYIAQLEIIGDNSHGVWHFNKELNNNLC
jgi:ferritin heavy chain